MWVLIFLTIVLAGLIHWFLNGTYGFWKQRNVPYVEPSPLVGNMGPSLTFSKHLGVMYKEFYDKFKDCAWIGIYRFRNPAILIRDIDLLKKLAIKDFSSFHDNDFEVNEEKEPIFGRNPFFLKGKRWKIVRSQVTSAITTGKIRNMFTIINNITKNLVNYLNKTIDENNNKGIDAKDLSARFTTDVVATCAFGLDGKSFTENEPEFKKMGEKLFQPEGFDKIIVFIVFTFPSLAKYFNTSFISKTTKEWFVNILSQTIEYREKNNIQRNDYLDMMLSLKNKPGEYAFTDIDVMAQSMTFYSDGMETSATALSFVLFELAKHPKIQQKLREDTDKVLKKYNGEISYDMVQEIPYLEMVIYETMRLYPPASFLGKMCTQKYTLPPPRGEGTGPGIEINEGMSVVIPVLGIHMDPEIYPEPEKFIPERFTEEEKANRSKCSFMTFGEGPRQCLGFRFALAQIKGALAAIVTNFNIKLNKKTTPDFVIDPYSFILAKKDGIYLDFEKIST